MPNVIKPKRSNTASLVPTTSNLTSGEIGVNMADRKIYINNGTAVVQVGAGTLSALEGVSISSPTNGQALVYNGTSWVNQTGGGAGDVVGPASSTDNAIARFDGSTGKLIQNSIVNLDDNGNLQNLNGIAFDTTPTSAPTAAGAMFWDSGDGTPSVVLNANTSLQLGQENIALVYNGTGSTITKGSVVAVIGAQGQRPSVALSDADSESLSAATLGVAAENIANGAEGFVCTFGLVRGLNTTGFTAGAPVYLSQTAGAFTATKPLSPAHLVFLGWVVKVNASSGEVFVHISNGWELDELHNVLITSPTSGNTLIYDATAGVWKNANLTDGTGITITEGAGSITIANAGVTSLTGTANEVEVSASTGAVTISLPATINANTTGNAANVTGTVAIANGGTGATTNTAARTNLGATTIGSNLFTLTNPSAVTFPRFNADNTVSALDAATFRTAIGAGTSSTTGTVTSVGGTGSVNGITLTGTVTSSGNLTLGGTLSNVSLTSQVTGTLPVGNGGTGAATLAANNVLLGNGTSALQAVAPGTSGNVLTSNGTTWTSAAPTAGSITARMIYNSFTATAGQTTFTTSQAYTSGKIDVYANGIRMVNGADVTVTSGTSVVFATGLTVGTTVDINFPT